VSTPTSRAGRPGRTALSLVLCAGLAAGVAGCGLLDRGGDPAAEPAPTLSASPLPSTAAPAPKAELKRYYRQDLAWSDCRDDLRCAQIEVPLDYAHPEANSISLALLKVPAEDPDQRVGSLVVNPGGPGGSGIEYAARADLAFGAELRRVYDIVGFDPRGVGESTPVDCVADPELDTFVASDPDPDTPAEREATARMLAELGQGCVEHSGDLAAHVSTEEVARDLDIIRAVLGDRTLSYFGASYGTFLGATYADLFPERVGRMVLDGALDPAATTEEINLVQARGFETALRAYVRHCVDQGGCFLGDSVQAGTARIRDFLDRVEKSPLPGRDGRQLQIGNAVLGIWLPLYSPGNWPVLDTALQAAFAGDGAILLALADQYTSRTASGYADNSLEALYAVNCLDHDDAIPVDEVPSHVAEFEKASPTFGAIFAYGLSSCAQWPVHTGRVAEPVEAAGAAPILVVGTSRDPATPMRWAVSLAEQLDSGVLVRRDGDGHTGYRAGNACVDRTVEAYLVSGDVPDGTVRC
jgi:pimeloyl-ACP methyl ester carboxylesterase